MKIKDQWTTTTTTYELADAIETVGPGGQPIRDVIRISVKTDADGEHTVQVQGVRKGQRNHYWHYVSNDEDQRILAELGVAYGPLTANQANLVADVLRAAQGCLRVAWLLDGGEVAVGTARNIGDERGNYAPAGVDIRGEYLRVTGDAGFEHFFKVIDLLPKIAEGTFVVNYQG